MKSLGTMISYIGRKKAWSRVILLCALSISTPALAATEFAVSVPSSVEKNPITGRLIVVVSKEETPEPRTALGLYGPPGFGKDITEYRPGNTIVVDNQSDGYPIDLDMLPAGNYFVQAILVRYYPIKRADGHTIWLPQATRSNLSYLLPGNLYSKVARFHIDPASDTPMRLELTETIAPDPVPQDTPWIKNVRIKSEILTKFWGTPIFIGARILLPKGYADHPDVRYPTAYLLSHGNVAFGFDTDATSNTERAQARARDANVETGYQFAEEWQSENFPRIAAVTFELAGPYFFENYAVNSANSGPYGDALTQEMIPYLEKRFRLIPEPYARVVEGASTGGWDSLALQLNYPDFFGGAWVFNPDPIDFRRYGLVNIYEDENMFTLPLNDLMSSERPFKRTREGQPVLSVRELARLEAMMGSHGRSYYQLDAWQITHGPVGDDGYPKPLFDKKTGAIDRSVAEYMREHGFDLTEYARRNWSTLGPKLAGKLNIFAGEQDDFFLNLAVYNFQDMVRETAGPDYPIRFEYGRPKKGHNWHHKNWAGTVHEMAEQFRKNTPEGQKIAWEY